VKLLYTYRHAVAIQIRRCMIVEPFRLSLVMRNTYLNRIFNAAAASLMTHETLTTTSVRLEAGGVAGVTPHLANGSIDEDTGADI
jgi:hypothetical protein